MSKNKRPFSEEGHDEQWRNALFDRCVRRRLRNDGTLSIRCRLGLWAVRSADLDAAEREARHYWMQYYEDGEYSALLSNTRRRTLALAPCWTILRKHRELKS